MTLLNEYFHSVKAVRSHLRECGEAVESRGDLALRKERQHLLWLAVANRRLVHISAAN